MPQPFVVGHRFVFLDGLRGIAAVVVMLYHFTQHTSHPIAELGSVCVDLFFCLSGFVIARELETLARVSQIVHCSSQGPRIDVGARGCAGCGGDAEIMDREEDLADALKREYSCRIPTVREGYGVFA
jgi:hypothetical protein